MKKDTLCEEAAERYYRAIYLYCLQLLNQDVLAAEDCTQDVFALMIQKKDTLDFYQNIRGWLYATADRICKDYRKREMKRTSLITASLDEITDIPDPDSPIDSDTILDCLSDEEVQLLKEYYSEQYGVRMLLAEKCGMTHSQLGKKIYAIRQKLKKHLKG